MVALLTLVTLTSGQVDSIRIPETSGCVIVELVLERIDNSIRQLVGVYYMYTHMHIIYKTICCTCHVITILYILAAKEASYGQTGLIIHMFIY